MRPELERVLGLELTSDVLRCLTHAETLDTAGSGTGKRYSARARYLPHAVRAEEDTCVRRACELLLRIIERMRPTASGRGRALSRALWLGRLAGREGRWGLADRIGVSVRQLEHYLVVLAPIVGRWQPPASEVGPRFVGRVSGHAYAIYELRRDMPVATKRALGGRWLRRDDVPRDVARTEREASTRIEAFAVLMPEPGAQPRTNDRQNLGGPRTGPPAAADPFLALIPR